MSATISNQRIARLGDLFVLLVPDEQDRHRLQSWQLDLQNRYGGQLVVPIHITAARFTPRAGLTSQHCAQYLASKLADQPSTPLHTDALIQFFAPYWQRPVLRWRVQRTRAWQKLRSEIEAILEMIDCPTHFERQRHATCTALNLTSTVELENPPTKRALPAPLFVVHTIWISMLAGDHEFTVLHEIKLRNSTDENTPAQT